MTNDATKDAMKKLAQTARQRDHDKFFQWLERGGLSAPDGRTKEGFSESSRLRELYEFCMWCNDHDAVLTDIMPFGLVAADDPDERSYSPEGGITIGHWPYLRECCGPKGDEDCIRLSHNELAEAILTNELQRKGHPYHIANGAVRELERRCDEERANFCSILTLPFDDVTRSLDERAAEIATELRKWPEALHPDGPDEKRGWFWWRNEPFPLGKTEYEVVSLLWAAPEHSLLLDEVVGKVTEWKGRTALSHQYIGRAKTLCSRISAKCSRFEISMRKDPEQMGAHYRLTLSIV